MASWRAGQTERLEQAVTAFTEALKERTRERVPLDWAMTQNNRARATPLRSSTGPRRRTISAAPLERDRTP